MEGFSAELRPGPPAVLLIQGELDIATTDAVTKAVLEALGTYDELVVDLSGVTFIDCSGLRGLLTAAKSLNGEGPLVLVHARLVSRLLDIVGLHDLAMIAIAEEA